MTKKSQDIPKVEWDQFSVKLKKEKHVREWLKQNNLTMAQFVQPLIDEAMGKSNPDNAAAKLARVVEGAKAVDRAMQVDQKIQANLKKSEEILSTAQAHKLALQAAFGENYLRLDDSKKSKAVRDYVRTLARYWAATIPGLRMNKKVAFSIQVHGIGPVRVSLQDAFNENYYRVEGAHDVDEVGRFWRHQQFEARQAVKVLWGSDLRALAEPGPGHGMLALLPDD